MAKPYKQEKKAYKKAKRKYVSFWKTIALFWAILTLIMLPLNIVLGMFDNTISLLVAGNGFWELENRDANAIYYPGMGVSQAERLEAGQALCYEVEAEGAALLSNNGALPLAAGAKVSTLSVNSVDLTYGGTGSGNVDASKADNLKAALEKSGFEVNAKLWDWYNSEEAIALKEASAEGGTGGENATLGGQAPISEIDPANYPAEVADSIAAYGDAVIITFSRVGGEGYDCAFPGYVDGNGVTSQMNYLALNDNERALMAYADGLKKEGKINLALGKPVTAHNDPSGNSQRLTDGDTNTNWDAGRLSATGKPYESTITPGWAVIDLGKEYLLTDIELVFGKNVWHHYEIYVSTDNNSWTKVGEKKDDKLPGTDADKYSKRTAIALQEITVLGKEIDASQLSAKVDQAKKLKQENYSAESWKALADALAQAEKVLASQSLSKAEVDAALEALTSALLNLKGADKPGNGEENNNGTEEDEGQQNGGNSSGENSGSENPDPNNPAPENPDDKKNGGAGKAALIALAAVLGIALAGGLALLVIKKNKK